MQHYGSEVAFFSSGLEGGGAERVVLDLASSLASLGYSVDIAVLRDKGALREQIPPGVRYISLSGLAHTPITQYRAYLAQYRPQRLVAFLENPSLLASVNAKLSRTHPPLFIRVDGEFMWRRMDRPMKSRFPDWIKYWIARWSYTSAERVLVVSDSLLHALASVFTGCNLSRCYNPVSLTPAHRHPARQRRHILAVGRLLPVKSFDTLLRALATLPEDYHLTILGEGHMRGELEALSAELNINKRVRMPGFVSDPKPYYEAADLFVLCSINEGLPTVLLEALASDLPVVSTDCKYGPEEILAGGKFGSLVPIRDPQALAAAIAATDEQPNPMTIHGFQSHLEQFSVDQTTSNFLRLIGIAPLSRPIDGRETSQT